MRRFSGTSSLIRILLPLLLVAGGAGIGLATPPRSLPARAASLKFAVIGDNGTGRPPQYDVARQMSLARMTFPFSLVLMVGDNFYGSQGPADLMAKFEEPYRRLLDQGVDVGRGAAAARLADELEQAPRDLLAPVRFLLDETKVGGKVLEGVQPRELGIGRPFVR